MTNRVTEIAIHPFREDEENGWYNTGGEGKPDGWNVHTFAAGDDDDEDDDDEDLWVDEDFDDYDSPWAFALELSGKYGVGIDHRY